jgi:hypothetical protein
VSAQQEGPQTPFEVYCHRCKVTFAVGTKRCIHCGGRIGSERFRPGLELPPGAGDLDLEESVGRRSGLSPFTLVWVALLLVGYLYRACTD